MKKKENEEKEEEKICSICGKPWLYALKTHVDGDERSCQHDGNVVSTAMGEEARYKNHLDKREKIVKRHENGTLPKSYYSTRYDKVKKKNVPYLSPKRLQTDSSLGGTRTFSLSGK